MSEFRPIFCCDFDGCVHRYSRGWCRGEIYDGVVDGWWAWLEAAVQVGQVAIYSSRSATPEGIAAMKAWLTTKACEHYPSHTEAFYWLEKIGWPDRKPPAWVTIDDRGVTFTGRWDAPELAPERLAAFKPWMQVGKQ